MCPSQSGDSPYGATRAGTDELSVSYSKRHVESVRREVGPLAIEPLDLLADTRYLALRLQQCLPRQIVSVRVCYCA